MDVCSSPSPRLADKTTMTILLQPKPELTRVVQYKLFRWWITAIMRHWKPGETARCRLCPQCMAYKDGCLTVVSGKVEAEDAEMLSIGKMRIQGPA